jgi:Cu(I)/Ag(I) efflux system membrane protein CusA/SilA
MLVYLREAIDKRGGLEHIRSLDELREAVIEGAVHRLRPKLLTEGVAIVAIFPMVFATGVGAEVLAPMALPVLGGLLISDEVVDLFLPVRFFWARRARWLKLQAAGKLAHQQTKHSETPPHPATTAGDGVEAPAGANDRTGRPVPAGGTTEGVG